MIKTFLIFILLGTSVGWPSPQKADRPHAQCLGELIKLNPKGSEADFRTTIVSDQPSVLQQILDIEQGHAQKPEVETLLEVMIKAQPDLDDLGVVDNIDVLRLDRLARFRRLASEMQPLTAKATEILGSQAAKSLVEDYLIFGNSLPEGLVAAPPLDTQELWHKFESEIDGAKLKAMSISEKAGVVKKVMVLGHLAGYETHLENGFFRFLLTLLMQETSAKISVDQDKQMDLGYHLLEAYLELAKYSEFGHRESFLVNLASVFNVPSAGKRANLIYRYLFYKMPCPCSPPQPILKHE